MPQYVPLTARFIRDSSSALNELDSFGSGCAAIESAGLAAPYLEEIESPFPPTSAGAPSWPASSSCAGSGRFHRLLPRHGSAGARDRRDRGRRRGDRGRDRVVVQIRGLHLPITRLELATATIVRADTVEVPADARAAEGGGGAGWEPVFLAAARVSAGEPRRTTPRRGRMRVRGRSKPFAN